MVDLEIHVYINYRRTAMTSCVINNSLGVPSEIVASFYGFSFKSKLIVVYLDAFEELEGKLQNLTKSLNKKLATSLTAE